MSAKLAWVYILADGPFGTLYLGMTSNLQQRMWQHKEEVFEGHTKKYGIKKLVWYVEFQSIKEAIAYEKRLKKWKRDWKIDLIKKFNPEWRDLSEDMT